MKLSIIIPCFNEEKTIIKIINKITKLNLINCDKEIIVIDDGSTDKSMELIKNYNNIIVIYNKKNYGKGYSIKKGIEKATGDILIIQDADLEYDPFDYNLILEKFKDNKVSVVYGSRRLKKNNYSSITFYLGGILLTYLVNILYFKSKNITDEPTCYKSFRSSLIKKIPLKSNGFEICPEITVKLLNLGIEIYEVPISYYPRSKKEGKKIKWIDGIIAIYTIIKYRFFND
tara:strand:+ start:5868 stop:6557 length:690 start_codon:yes stop_codon:yes gene_type:complete